MLHSCQYSSDPYIFFRTIMDSLVAFENQVKCTFCYFTGGFGGYNSRGQRGGNRGNRGNRGSGYSNNGGYNRGRGGNNYMNGGGNRNNYGNGNRGNRSGMLSLCCICSALFISSRRHRR